MAIVQAAGEMYALRDGEPGAAHLTAPAVTDVIGLLEPAKPASAAPAPTARREDSMSVRRGRLAAAALCLSLGGCASSQPPSPTAAPIDESGRAASLGAEAAAKAAPSPALANSATSTAPGDADARLGAAFDARFAAADGTALWAVRLERLGSRAVLASRNEDRLVLPASNMKIVTLAAAATRLGWDYRFRTRCTAQACAIGTCCTATSWWSAARTRRSDAVRTRWPRSADGRSSCERRGCAAWTATSSAMRRASARSGSATRGAGTTCRRGTRRPTRD